MLVGGVLGALLVGTLSVCIFSRGARSWITGQTGTTSVAIYFSSLPDLPKTYSPGASAMVDVTVANRGSHRETGVVRLSTDSLGGRNEEFGAVHVRLEPGRVERVSMRFHYPRLGKWGRVAVTYESRDERDGVYFWVLKRG